MSKENNKKASRTAQMVCLMRAMSFYEEDEAYKSADYIAPAFVPIVFRIIAKTKFLRERFKKALPYPGMYEYVIARTKIVDDVFQNISPEIKQALIFGAGFDSRAVRFKNELNKVTVFELDSAETQQAKLKKLSDRKIVLPEGLKFISIDFDKETLPQKLEENSFVKDKPCLILLEGLVMFLDQKSVENLLEEISKLCGKGSILVFDYLYSSVLGGGNSSGESVTETVSRLGENYKSGFEKGAVKGFLSEYGFEVIDEFDAQRLKEKYFYSENAMVSPIDLYGIVIAKKV